MQHMIEEYPGMRSNINNQEDGSARPVWSCNEWDPLQEVIIGNPLNARYPFNDPSSQIAEFAGIEHSAIPQGDIPKWVIEETEEDLSEFATALEKLGVCVRRPDNWEHSTPISTSFWETKGFYNYCPRDIMLVIGDQVIETPNAIRGRYLETHSYRPILLDYFMRGAKWVSAPKPMLLDETFDVSVKHPVPKNHEPIFDAANVLRFGSDLLYLVSSTGNELGAKWLQSVLGEKFKVHVCNINYFGSHIDTSVVALRPGLLLCNPERVTKDMLPAIFQDWKIIYSPEMIPSQSHSDEYLSGCIGSSWIDMNLFSISPDLVVVDRGQEPLIELLESNGIGTVPLKLRHSRMLGGGFHCTTLDTKRKGKMESYFT